METAIYVAIYVAIIIILLLIIYFINLNKNFERLRIRLIEVEEHIDDYLKIKGKLLLEVCNFINDLNKKKVFTGLSFVEKNNYDSFQLDKELDNLYCSLKEYLVMNKAFVSDEEFEKKMNILNENEVELDGSKIFYNDISRRFNQLLDNFPSSLVAKRKGYDFKYLYSFEKEEFFKIIDQDKKKNK